MALIMTLHAALPSDTLGIYQAFLPSAPEQELIELLSFLRKYLTTKVRSFSIHHINHHEGVHFRSNILHGGVFCGGSQLYQCRSYASLELGCRDLLISCRDHRRVQRPRRGFKLDRRYLGCVHPRRMRVVHGVHIFHHLARYVSLQYKYSDRIEWARVSGTQAKLTCDINRNQLRINRWKVR